MAIDWLSLYQHCTEVHYCDDIDLASIDVYIMQISSDTNLALHFCSLKLFPPIKL